MEENTLEDGNKSRGMCPPAPSADGRLKREFVTSGSGFCAAAGGRAAAAGESTTQGADANDVRWHRGKGRVLRAGGNA